MGLDTSPDQPAPVRQVAQLVGQWIDRLGPVWVEGQVAQLTRRPGAGLVFVTLRDTAAEVSLPVTCSRRVIDAAEPPIAEGTRVVVHAKPGFYLARGSFSMQAREIRHVGLGELLARLERLKTMLAAEGLFAPERKKPLPFLPRTVGLVCGRASAAEKDVVENARRRWPAVQFSVQTVAVQGPTAAAQVTAALTRLDADPDVDVIIVTRGGGSVEDLLPFSEEPLLRAVAGCATPVVSAIGHEQDSPLLDLVADVRASTPTDAARRVVPDVAAELQAVARAREQIRRTVHALVDNETRRCADLRDRVRRAMAGRLDRERDGLAHTTARLRSLSPQATLDRGYAVVQRDDGAVVRAPEEVRPAEHLLVRVAGGSFDAARVPPPTDRRSGAAT
ncbi:MAG: exodeoxyribonuclease VII large subunit [Actinomycetota bacterium]|nr:exodeoxyribonuclease VII large subunit [Actinomycetota bacterium]MDH5278037.1 exodeoxyribonuclease VII large subunit [Actinomycetota bacterium]